MGVYILVTHLNSNSADYTYGMCTIKGYIPKISYDHHNIYIFTISYKQHNPSISVCILGAL